MLGVQNWHLKATMMGEDEVELLRHIHIFNSFLLFCRPFSHVQYVEMSDGLDAMTVSELKAHLDNHGLDYSGYLEKTDLIKLARGQLPPCESKADPFFAAQFGSASALAAQFQMKVEQWSIKQLKAHLDKIGRSYAGVFEKQELVALVLEGARNKTAKELEVEFSEPSESVLEC